MTDSKIWLSSPHMGGREREYVNEAFSENWIAPLGPNVDGFETGLGNYLKTEHVVALSSGTAALHLSLIMAGVTAGDLVLCQSFTFSASANPILYQGARPVFIDSEKDTWNMCPLLLEEAIQDCIQNDRKPKACIVVHLYGMPARIQEISLICRKYGIPLIEDAAEGLGSKYEDKYLGTMGDFGILSFNGNKIITTSGGGALVCKSKEESDQAKFLATQARDPAPHYEHSVTGYNYRLSNICAGIGRGQLEVLDKWVALRRRNFEYYHQHLKDFDNIRFLMEPEKCFSNRWLSCVVFESFEQREKVRKDLGDSNIESRPLWKPMHLQPVFKGSKRYANGVSEELFKKGLCLPSGSNLTPGDLDKVIRIIRVSQKEIPGVAGSH